MPTLERTVATLSSSASGPARRETFRGRPHLVVPIVLMVEGVHAGSGGPLYFPPDEIERGADLWNGTEITLLHPKTAEGFITANTPETLEAQGIGKIFAARYESDKRRTVAEAWIDEQALAALSPQALAAVKAGESMDISVGVLNDEMDGPGTWREEKYRAVARNQAPDHVALLPGLEGACSQSDGCGLNVLEKGAAMNDDEKKDKPKGVATKVIEFLGRAANSVGHALTLGKDGQFDLTALELSHQDKCVALQRALDTQDAGGWRHYVRDVYDEYVVYEAYTSNPNEVGYSSAAGGVSKLYRRGYAINEEGAVTLNSEIDEVREVTEYVPVANEATSGEEETVNKKAKVDALIACDKTRFTEADREWLMSQDEARLTTFEAVKPCDHEVTSLEATPPKTETAPAPKKPATLESYVSDAPASVQSVLRRAVTRYDADKAALVKSLSENERCKFDATELAAMDLDMLERLATLADVPVGTSYAGAVGGGRTREATSQQSQVPEPPDFWAEQTAAKN